MTAAPGQPSASGHGWADACLAVRVLAVDPALGLDLCAPPGAARDHVVAGLRGNQPGVPWRRLPAGVPEARLIGGLDLAGTLAAGRPVVLRGLLADCDGGLLVVASAERLDPGLAAQLCRALDTGQVRLERDGLSAATPARFGVVALDEGREATEGTPPALRDRLALRLDLRALGHRDCGPIPVEADAIAAARLRLPAVSAGPDMAEALCAAADVLGLAGLRGPLLALRVARACAALADRPSVSTDDLAAAARLVLGPRATRLPAPDRDAGDDRPAPEPDGPDQTPPEQDPGPDPAENSADPEPPRDDEPSTGAGRLEAMAVAAATAALPGDVLAALASAAAATPHGVATGGRAGAETGSGRRGRPVAARRGAPARGRTLDVLATLRAAAPWQAMRGRRPGAAIRLRAEDLHVRRRRDRQRGLTIFAVDASGSAALGRLAEAKGAVELLLAACYVRRDEVALVSFRGSEAEVLLPPTRAPARAKRELAALPGGGATPLASGVAAALGLALAAVRAGRRPVLALLTDGRGNVARDGTLDRARATEDGLAAGRAVRSAGIAAVVIDVSPRPGPAAARLASEMGATYLPLPLADARGIAGAVRTVTEPDRRRP